VNMVKRDLEPPLAGAAAEGHHQNRDGAKYGAGTGCVDAGFEGMGSGCPPKQLGLIL
jgi:hypothetical protein